MVARRTEDGFTLIELLVAMTISSLILGAVAGAFIVTSANYTASASRLSQSNDAQLLTAWVMPDITSAGSGSSNIDTTGAANPCAIPTSGLDIVAFTWSAYDGTGTLTGTDAADYRLEGSVLVRYYCTITLLNEPSTAQSTIVGRNVEAPGVSGSQTSVTVNGAEVNFQVTDLVGGSQYTFAVSASRRTGVHLAVSAPSLDAATTPLAAGSITANLAGASIDPLARGSIGFTVFGPSPTPPDACTSGGTTVGSAVTVAGNGTYAASAGYTPPAAGDYWWYASYAPDANNQPTDSGCPSAVETVVKNPTTVSAIAPGTDPSNGPISASTIEATLSNGTTSPPVSGTVSLAVFGPSPTPPNTCTNGGTTVGSAVGVAGNGTYAASAGYTPSTAGDYWWYATYSGDSLNNNSHSTCPPVAETVVGAGVPAFSIKSGQSVSSLGSNIVGGAVTGFGPNESLMISLDAVGGTVLTTNPVSLVTDTNGQYGQPTAFSVTIPGNITGGTHRLWAADSSGDSAQSTGFTVTSNLSFTSSQNFSSPPGTLVGGSAAAFGPNENLSFHLDSASGNVLSTSPGTVTTDLNGTAPSFTVTIPSGTPNGTHTVVAVGNNSNLAAPSNTFTVSVPRTCTLTTDTGDTDIQSGAKANGSASSMNTDPAGSGTNALVQFGVLSSTCTEGGTLPSNAVVTNATLTLTTATATRSTIGIALAGSLWSENSLSWSSATQQEKHPSGSNTATVSSTVVSWDVTSNVQSIVAGAPDGGWALWDTVSTDPQSSFFTKEYASAGNRPKLVITYH